MKSYHVDVSMRFTVTASSEDEAREAVKQGLSEGRYEPSNSEIMVSVFVGKDEG